MILFFFIQKNDRSLNFIESIINFNSNYYFSFILKYNILKPILNIFKYIIILKYQKYLEN